MVTYEELFSVLQSKKVSENINSYDSRAMSEDTSISSRKSFFTKRNELIFIARMTSQTYFSENNLKYLVRFFKKRAQEGQYMDKSDFLVMLHEVLGYREHFFMNRVFNLADLKTDGKVDMEEFVRFMSLVLKGTREEQIDFCFNCYDLNETKQLTRDVIITLLSHTGSEASDRNADTVLDILDLLLRKLDQDADGVILHDEFKKAAMEDWLFTEAFGQCLPDYTKHMSFLENMEKNITIE